MTEKPTVLVIGAGIGGLTSAALLAQAGLTVTVLEANPYPGGCASTFYYKGYRFDSGATVAGGFQENGPHTLVSRRLNIQFPVRPTDPAWFVQLAGRRISFGRDNSDVLKQFPRSVPFWQAQRALATQVWSLAAAGLPWIPQDASELAQLLRVALPRFPGLMRLAPYFFMNCRQWMARYGLTKDEEFVRLLDAQLLISAQTTTSQANALYSAIALDLPRQGTYQVEGGMGRIAETLAASVQSFGGQVLYRRQVTGIDVQGGRARGIYVRTGKRATETQYLPADWIVANLTPASLALLLGERIRNREEEGWGAFVIHLGLEQARLPHDLAGHTQIVRNPRKALGEGNSLFLSLSPGWDKSRAPAGYRAATVSTHTEVGAWWQLRQRAKKAYEARKAAYQAALLEGIECAFPGFGEAVAFALPGTPITYERYTGRYQGLVGGFPQRSLWRARSPRTSVSNLRLVGDSIFPGQSTAGVTLGAMRVADDLLRGVQAHTAR